MNILSRISIVLIILLLLSAFFVCPVMSATESPKTISPQKTLDALIKSKHTENLPSNEKCREIGYKYESTTETWELRGGYSSFSHYWGNTIKIKPKDDDTRAKLLEYMYYVDQCSDKFTEENIALLVVSGGVLMVVGGPVGIVAFTIEVGCAVIKISTLGDDMDQCTEYAKNIYKELSKVKEDL